MKQSWIKGLNDERQIQVRSDFVGAASIRKRLEELLNDKIKVSQSTSRSKENYNISNWAYLQADNIGYERALIEVISLISDKIVE